MKCVTDRGGEHLMFIKRIETNDYMAALHWDEPPTIAVVENALNTHTGAAIRKLGVLEV